jgi:hypothetical protein
LDQLWAKRKKSNSFKLSLGLRTLPQSQKLGQKKIANKWLKKGLGFSTLPQVRNLGQQWAN